MGGKTSNQSVNSVEHKNHYLAIVVFFNILLIDFKVK